MTIKPQDIFGSAPETVLNKPFMHVQDQKTSGTGGGTSSVGNNDRDLTVVVTNEISGASLSTNQITLPAGEYYIEASTPVFDTTTGAARTFLKTSADTVLLAGRNNNPYYGNELVASGKVTLASSTVIKLVTYTSVGEATIGLGGSSGIAPYEVYSDIRIWKLDSLIRTPVLSGNSLYPLPGNSFVTGNMYGLEYQRTGDHTINVDAGICMDSLNTTLLSASSGQSVTIGSTINEIYHLFLCDDDVVRTDTDVGGSSLGAYEIRWIGFVPTDASGDIYDFWMSENTISGLDIPLATGVGTTYTSVGVSAVIPTVRIAGISYRFDRSVASGLWTSYDGVVDALYEFNDIAATYVTSPRIASSDTMYFKCSSGTTDVGVSTIQLRR